MVLTLIMIKYNTQPHTDGGDILRQCLAAIADGDVVKQEQLQEAVADLERQFLEQHGNGLCLDVPARVDLADRWAAIMDSRRGTRHYSKILDNNVYFATGHFFGYFVVAFPIPGADGTTIGYTAYRLTGDNFGATAKWFTPPEWVVLNDLGEMVPTAKPLPLGGTDNPTPQAVQQWRREWFDLREYKRLHKGRTPEEQAEYEERRRRWREDNNKDKGDDHSDDNQSKED